MPITLKDVHQSLIDQANTIVAAWDPDPEINASGEVYEGVADKNTALTNLLTQANNSNNVIKSIYYNTNLENQALLGAVPGQYPAIFGVKAMYNPGFQSMSSEWGQSTSHVFWRRLLALSAGMADPAATTPYTSFPDNVTSFEVPPYLQPNCHRTHESCKVGVVFHTIYADGNFNNYPNMPFVIFTIKNSDPVNAKTVPLRIAGSSNSNNGAYSYFGIVTFTPDQPNSNRAATTEAGTFATSAASSGAAGWYHVTNYSGNTGIATHTPSIVIPADKSVIVMARAPAYLYTTGTSLYFMGRNLFLQNIKAIYDVDPANLTPDVNILKNIMNKNLANLQALYTYTPA